MVDPAAGDPAARFVVVFVVVVVFVLFSAAKAVLLKISAIANINNTDAIDFCSINTASCPKK